MEITSFLTPTLLITIVVAIAASLFVSMTLKYLNPSKESINTNNEKNINQTKEILKEKLSEKEIKDTDLKLKEKEESLIRIRNELEAVTDIIKLRRNTILRLKNYVLDINRKANLNLVYGLLFCISGIVFIFYSLTIYIPSPQSALKDTVTYFLPRISLTILIEIFSYFFLNLYKKNLEDIKYFQNEVTNLESKYLAILYAFESNNGQVKAKVIEKLMDTERNFVLKKDETTIDLEKNRIDAQSSNSTVQALKDIINFKR